MAGFGLTGRAAVVTATVASAAALAAGCMAARRMGLTGLPGRRSALFTRSILGACRASGGSPAPAAAGVELTLVTCGRLGWPADREPLVNELARRYVEWVSD